MPTAVRRPPAGLQCFLFDDVSWGFYDRTLRELEAKHRRIRVTYDEGSMELMTVGDEHERTKTTLARLVELYSLEEDVPVTGLGSITCRRKTLRKGLEPDECYYVRTPAPPMSRKALDLEQFPPPDLAIEVDVSYSSIPREPIYAALKVREVWRARGAAVEFLERQQDGSYAATDASLAFPALRPEVISRFVRMALERSQHEAAKAFRQWIRKQGRK